MRTKLTMALAGLGLMTLAGAPLLAHHAFGGEFDPNKPVLLKGKVVKVEWVNPHAWIHLETAKPDGAKPCHQSRVHPGAGACASSTLARSGTGFRASIDAWRNGGRDDSQWPASPAG